MLYFDHNATSPVHPVARAAWLEALDRFAANPSSPHRWGARADAAIADARVAAAHLLGCAPLDVIWTSGATEAANALFAHAASTSTGPALLSAVEHPCVRASAQHWFRGRVEVLPVHPSGVVNLDLLSHRLSHGDVALVAVMAANNETGICQPWQAVLELCRHQRVPYACDAVQWVGKLPANGLGACDFVMGSAHKFGGAPGTGFLKVPRGFKPFLRGGPQEDGRRAGTENVPGILAMLAAWQHREANATPGAIRQREDWRDAFLGAMAAELSGFESIGGSVPRLWNTASVLMPSPADCRRRWVAALDRAGVAASTGSACSSGQEKPSETLLAMGLDPSQTDRMIRFSAGWETTEADWLELLGCVRKAAGFLQQPARVGESALKE